MSEPGDGAVAKPAPAGRRRPARGARVGALVLSCAATAGLAVLFAETDTSTSSGAVVPDLPAPIPAAAVAPGATAGPAGGASAGATVGFDGDVVATKYGPVQVQAQLSGGQLVDIAVIEYPDADRRSSQISVDALPTLRVEVLVAQTADVDAVSGATYTSDGYLRSLQSAIDRARAAGATTLT